ncbi:MAG: FkbM family methyltransferase [Holosporaceae bacterium]|jgi:FkbM family methyltransferase|nr:FkbM family methyltransferase [Holosporaceae bacterium]
MKQFLKSAQIFSGKHPLYAIIFLLCAFILLVLPNNRDYKESLYKLCKTNQNLWIAVIRNEYISLHIEKNSVWEPHVTNYLVKNVKPSETVIEIGANIGYYTTLLSKLVGSKGKVYSYEANKKVYDLACLSLKMNDLYNIVTIKNIVISDRKGTVDFVSYEPSLDADIVNIGGSHILTDYGIYDLLYDKTIKTIKTTSLDEDLPNLKSVDWLRMDIEGSEILALKGARRIINSSPNLKIVMEWFPNIMKKYGDVQKLIKDLRGYGFKFYKISDCDADLKRDLSDDYLLNIVGLEDLVLIR